MHSFMQEYIFCEEVNKITKSPPSLIWMFLIKYGIYNNMVIISYLRFDALDVKHHTLNFAGTKEYVAVWWPLKWQAMTDAGQSDRGH